MHEFAETRKPEFVTESFCRLPLIIQVKVYKNIVGNNNTERRSRDYFYQAGDGDKQRRLR